MGKHKEKEIKTNAMRILEKNIQKMYLYLKV